MVSEGGYRNGAALILGFRHRWAAYPGGRADAIFIAELRDTP